MSFQRLKPTIPHNALDLINLHRPHPSNEVKAYVIRQVREKLEKGRRL